MTPLTAALEDSNPAILNWFRDASPVPRMGETSDLTPMICYLLSDAASFTTGADMLVTGKFPLSNVVSSGFSLLLCCFFRGEEVGMASCGVSGRYMILVVQVVAELMY